MPERVGLGGLFVSLLLLLASGGCQTANYEGASFPPVEGPPKSSALLLYVFRPEGKGVPWGDAAFYHRESPAQLGAVPVPYQVSLDGGPYQNSAKQGDFTTRLTAGSHGIRVRLEGREILRSLNVGEDQSQIELWSLEPGGEIFGVRGGYGRTDLTAWPVHELSESLRRFRLFVKGFQLALESGREEELEGVLREDFRDPLGTRRDFSRAAAHDSLRGEPWQILGDAWLEEGGLGAHPLQAHLMLQRGAQRTFPTLQLEEAKLGPGGLQVRTLF